MKASLQGCLSTLSSNQKQEGHLAFSFSPEAGPNTSRKFLDFSWIKAYGAPVDLWERADEMCYPYPQAILVFALQLEQTGLRLPT